MSRASPHPFRWLLTVLSAAGLLLAVLAPTAVAQEQETQTENVEWGGGQEDLATEDCPDGAAEWHFVLTPAGNTTIVDADLSVTFEDSSGATDEGAPSGEQDDGSWHFFVQKDEGGTVSAATATVTYTGEKSGQSNFNLVISDVECVENGDDGNGDNGDNGDETVSLTITKVEEDSPETTLEDADFDLYLDDGDDTFESDEDTFEDSGTTGPDGTLTFSGLDPNETYFVVETDAPANYEVIGDGATLVEVGESNASVTIENAPITEVSPTLTLTVTKVEQGDNDNTLAGAIFELYADDGDTSGELDDNDSQHGDACTTDDEGVCQFSALAPNSTYFLVETDAPDQYEVVGDGVRTITTGEEDVSETVPNAAITEVEGVVEEREEDAAVADEQVERQQLARTGTETNLAIWAAALLFAGAILLLFPGQRLMPATAVRSSRRRSPRRQVWTARDASSLWSAAAERGERRGFQYRDTDDPG